MTLFSSTCNELNQPLSSNRKSSTQPHPDSPFNHSNFMFHLFFFILAFLFLAVFRPTGLHSQVFHAEGRHLRPGRIQYIDHISFFVSFAALSPLFSRLLMFHSILTDPKTRQIIQRRYQSAMVIITCWPLILSFFFFVREMTFFLSLVILCFISPRIQLCCPFF